MADYSVTQLNEDFDHLRYFWVVHNDVMASRGKIIPRGSVLGVTDVRSAVNPFYCYVRDLQAGFPFQRYSLSHADAVAAILRGDVEVIDYYSLVERTEGLKEELVNRKTLDDFYDNTPIADKPVAPFRPLQQLGGVFLEHDFADHTRGILEDGAGQRWFSRVYERSYLSQSYLNPCSEGNGELRFTLDKEGGLVGKLIQFNRLEQGLQNETVVCRLPAVSFSDYILFKLSDIAEGWSFFQANDSDGRRDSDEKMMRSIQDHYCMKSGKHGVIQSADSSLRTRIVIVPGRPLQRS